jgi:hypothetical protein
MAIERPTGAAESRTTDAMCPQRKSKTSAEVVFSLMPSRLFPSIRLDMGFLKYSCFAQIPESLAIAVTGDEDDRQRGTVVWIVSASEGHQSQRR